LQKNTPRPFLSHLTPFVTLKKDLDLCWRKFKGKVAQKRFGQVWGNSGKNPLQTPKFSVILHLWVGHSRPTWSTVCSSAPNAQAAVGPYPICGSGSGNVRHRFGGGYCRTTFTN